MPEYGKLLSLATLFTSAAAGGGWGGGGFHGGGGGSYGGGAWGGGAPAMPGGWGGSWAPAAPVVTVTAAPAPPTCASGQNLVQVNGVYGCQAPVPTTVYAVNPTTVYPAPAPIVPASTVVVVAPQSPTPPLPPPPPPPAQPAPVTTTVPAGPRISQIGDGQIQAPASPPAAAASLSTWTMNLSKGNGPASTSKPVLQTSDGKGLSHLANSAGLLLAVSLFAGVFL